MNLKLLKFIKMSHNKIKHLVMNSSLKQTILQIYNFFCRFLKFYENREIFETTFWNSEHP